MNNEQVLKYSWISKLSLYLSLSSSLVLVAAVSFMYFLLDDSSVHDSSYNVGIVIGLISSIKIAIIALIGVTVSLVLGVVGLMQKGLNKSYLKYSIASSGSVLVITAIIATILLIDK